MKEIEALSAPKTAPAAAATTPTPEGASAAKAGGGFFSNIFNPAMSLNGLLLGSVTSVDAPAAGEVQTGVRLQEVELQILANIDPYLSANVILSVPDGQGIGVEEGIVAVTSHPLGLSVRGGKLKLPFGRENPLHTHALPFVEKSLVGMAVFGEDGLSEIGGEVSYLLPLPWYTLATVAVVGGDNEVAFHSPNGRDLAGFAGLKNVFDLNDDATVEVGASYAIGNNIDRQVSQVMGGHLVFKWRPGMASTTRSIVVTVEGLYERVPRLDTPRGPQTDQWGLYAYAQFQLARRWYVSGRFDFLQPPGISRPAELRESALVVFVPTEFSAIRLQANVREPGGGGEPIIEGFLQINFTLGAHPAHSY